MPSKLVFSALLFAVLGFAQQAFAEIIHMHAKRGNLEGVIAELDKGVPLELRSTNMTSDPGVTPLFVAAKFGRIEVVKALLARGADPTIFFTVPDGLYQTGTALHHAARFGYLDVVEALLEAGADPASYDRYIATPLHHALRGGHAQVAEVLIASGAPVRRGAPPINDLLPKADIERGKLIASGCEIFHGVPSSDRPLGENGPNLWGVWGGPAASDSDYEYSRFLVEADLVWDVDTLNDYLHGPYKFLPGTSKIMMGIEDDADRAALISYLATLSD